MQRPVRFVTLAAIGAILSALLWSSYYFFVLGLNTSTGSAALFTYPLLIGGAAYAGWAFSAGHGRIFLALWRSPAAWLRTGLIAGMQLSVLASTYVAGAVDTSLLSLVGDVVMTPVLLMGLFGENRTQVRSPPFLLGISLSTAGATLTIVGGTALEGLSGIALVIAPVVPITVALYFLFSARANREVPSSAVVGQATVGGGLIGIALSPLFPQSVSGLAIPSLFALSLILALGITSFFLAPVLYFWAMERAGLLLPALLMATIPVFTLLLGLLIDRGLPPLIGLVGVPIAVIGAFFALGGEHVPWTPKYRRLPSGPAEAEPAASGTLTRSP